MSFWQVQRSLALLALGMSACAADEGCGPDSAVVRRVIDGDTVELASGERVRYLLVDSPEITSGKAECYGAEAREYNRALVENRAVSLRYDRECTDRFGRLLAYVSVNGTEVNSLLVERGYACVLHVAPNGAGRVEDFEALRDRARAGRAGLWGACEKNPCR